MPYISGTYLKLSEHAIQTPSYVRGRNTGVTKWPLPCIRVALSEWESVGLSLEHEKGPEGTFLGKVKGAVRSKASGVMCYMMNSARNRQIYA